MESVGIGFEQRSAVLRLDTVFVRIELFEPGNEQFKRFAVDHSFHHVGIGIPFVKFPYNGNALRARRPNSKNKTALFIADCRVRPHQFVRLEIFSVVK